MFDLMRIQWSLTMMLIIGKYLIVSNAWSKHGCSAVHVLKFTIVVRNARCETNCNHIIMVTKSLTNIIPSGCNINTSLSF